jgi:hypothetical protein
MTGNKHHKVRAFKNFHLSFTYSQVTELGGENRGHRGNKLNPWEWSVTAKRQFEMQQLRIAISITVSEENINDSSGLSSG